MDIKEFQINQKNTVLIVDDDPMSVTQLIHMLGSEHTLLVEKNGRGALETAATQKPDLILLDIVMPDMDGYEVIRALKLQEETSDIPVIFITGMDDRESEVKGLELGATDYIVKPFYPAIVRMRVGNQLQVINSRHILRRLSSIDALTEMPNRRYFNERVQHEWARAIRDVSPLGFLLLDIDDFRSFNNKYGHISGDVVLRAVADTIRNELRRSTDLAARWGGEEFAVILPNTDRLGAQEVANNIRAAIESAGVVLKDDISVSVTASIGANSIIPQADSSLNCFVSDTDKAMYCAKKAGKNCVRLTD